MVIPLNPLVIVFLLPSLITLAVQRARKVRWQEIFTDLGWRSSPLIYYLWGLLIALVLGGATILTLWFIAPDVLFHPARGTTQYYYAHLMPSFLTILFVFFNEAIFTTLGEEVFFRGLLGGWLMRHSGFALGNLLQSIVFLLPHLLLLAVSLHIWPIFIFQFAGAWAVGWLRYRSDSILPGWLSHTLINTMSDVIAMLY